MDPHTAEAFAWVVIILAVWVVFIVGVYLRIVRSPRKADREYHASLRNAAASYEDEGVHGDVVIVPMVGRPFADSEGGRRG
jgi:signal transduction histidine kinase